MKYSIHGNSLLTVSNSDSHILSKAWCTAGWAGPGLGLWLAEITHSTIATCGSKSGERGDTRVRVTEMQKEGEVFALSTHMCPNHEGRHWKRHCLTSYGITITLFLPVLSALTLVKLPPELKIEWPKKIWWRLSWQSPHMLAWISGLVYSSCLYSTPHTSRKDLVPRLA